MISEPKDVEAMMRLAQAIADIRPVKKRLDQAKARLNEAQTDVATLSLEYSSLQHMARQLVDEVVSCEEV